MTEPNKKYLSDERIPRITLAGVEWPVPHLAAEQLEIVVPLIFARVPTMSNGSVVGGITREAMHDWLSIVYWGLRRGHPELTREEFDAMEIDVDELMNAQPVIQKQTGLMKKKGDAKPGEAPGNLQTGTR
jgi:hypothetical protein